MVLRNKRISPDADVVQLSLSYSEVDVFRLFKFIFNQCLGADSEWMQTELLQTPFSEQLVMSYLTEHPKCFGNYDYKWAIQLSRWAFHQAIRNGYIKPSVTADNTIYFTDVCAVRRRGRPSKQLNEV